MDNLKSAIHLLSISICYYHDLLGKKMKFIVYIATSLDGYIADKNGNIDWLTNIDNPDGSDFGYAEFMADIDAVVMGRNTFETVLGFGGDWPFDKPVFVLSQSLSKLPESLPESVKLLQGTPKQIELALKPYHFQRVYVDGGKTIQAFLAENRVDELILTRVPILLGDGVPLFNQNNIQCNYRHVKTSVYLDTLVKSHYIKVE